MRDAFVYQPIQQYKSYIQHLYGKYHIIVYVWSAALQLSARRIQAAPQMRASYMNWKPASIIKRAIVHHGWSRVCSEPKVNTNSCWHLAGRMFSWACSNALRKETISIISAFSPNLGQNESLKTLTIRCEWGSSLQVMKAMSSHYSGSWKIWKLIHPVQGCIATKNNIWTGSRISSPADLVLVCFCFSSFP